MEWTKKKIETNPIAANPKHNLMFVTNNNKTDNIPLADVLLLSFAANN